jgi:hypothetical protein
MPLRSSPAATSPVARTSTSGIDIIAQSADPIVGGLFVIQCKRYAGKVGEPILRDLYGVVHHTNANKGILITSSGFTEHAIAFAAGKQLELIDGQRLAALLQQYGLTQQQPEDSEGRLVVPKPYLKLSKGLTELAGRIEKQMERNRLLVRPPDKSYDLGTFFAELALSTLSACESGAQSVGNIVADIGARLGEDGFTQEFADARVELIEEVVTETFKARECLAAALLPEPVVPTKSALLEIVDVFLRQLASFLRSFQAFDQMNNTTVPVDRDIVLKFLFAPTMDTEVQKYQLAMNQLVKELETTTNPPRRSWLRFLR